jgi:dinuclear metal center YbgI/SA1388 family protein
VALKRKQATVNDVVHVLDELARPSLAEEWDNVGLLVGHGDKPVKVILTALDFSKEVLDEAIKQKADMIVTHHPAIFKKLSALTNEDWRTNLLLQAVEHGIAIYSAHTNLDAALGGVNDVLAEYLDLKNIENLSGEDGNVNGIGRVGTLDKAMDLNRFAAKVKKCLELEYVLVASADKKVKKVAVCGGSGMDFLDLVIASGADTYVTGDVKYHNAQDAIGHGINIIDASHQGTELPIVNNWADRLALRLTRRDLNVKVLVAKESKLLKVM